MNQITNWEIGSPNPEAPNSAKRFILFQSSETTKKEESHLNEILTQEKSIYIQIKEMIESDILRDILLEEERVPSTNELAKLYAINPATAAKGVNLLVDEGILYKKRGIGMFVAEGAKEQIMKKKKEHFYDDYIKSLMAEARNLGITKQELITMIEESAEGGREDE